MSLIRFQHVLKKIGTSQKMRNFIVGEFFILIIQCNRHECNRLTYFQMLTDWNKKDVGQEEVNNLVIFQYPSGKAELPEYIPENIRKFYQEAVDAYNFGLLNSASIQLLYKINNFQRWLASEAGKKEGGLGEKFLPARRFWVVGGCAFAECNRTSQNSDFWLLTNSRFPLILIMNSNFF